MPALKLFGRKWRVGTDDFVFPGLFDLFATVNWIIASVIVYWASDHTWECSGQEKIMIYLYGIFLILNLIAITSSILIHHSKAGGIMDTQARHYVPHCLYTRLFLQLLGLLWNVIGSIWILDGSVDCSAAPHAVRFVKGYVICNWIFILFALIGAIIVFDPFGGDCAQRNKENPWNYTKGSFLLPELPDTKNTRVWTRRLRLLLFNWFICSNSRRNGLFEAGKLFGSVLGNTDLVPTDVVAGLLLLRLENKDAHADETLLQEVAPIRNKDKPPVTRQPDHNHTPNSDTLEHLFQHDWRNPILLSHFLKFARAVYSWPLVLFDKKPGAVRSLLSTSFLCSCIPGRHHPLDVVDDDCCFCNTSGVRNLVNIKDDDLIHLCFSNKVFKTPFFVALDVATKSIVVSIRGTLSNADVITDMTGWPMPINVPGLPPSFKGHHGMVLCARALKERLESMGILPRLLNEHPGYNIILTGTSLGAGTAAILSFMLRDTYPLLKCYAFSPPGGLLSMDAATFCNDFTTSVIYGNDIISRLSIRSIERLKYSLIDAMKLNTTPKYQIILGALTMFRGTRPVMVRPTLESAAVSQGTSRQSIPDEELHTGTTAIGFTHDDFKRSCDGYENGGSGNFTERFHHPMKVLSSSLQEECQLVPCGEMYPPGKIVYITETPDFSLGHKKRNYSGSSRWRMRWADRTEFGEIIIHDRLIGDHLPYRMYKALEVLAQSQVQIGQPVF